jgi:hypothetical protein
LFGVGSSAKAGATANNAVKSTGNPAQIQFLNFMEDFSITDVSVVWLRSL